MAINLAQALSIDPGLNGQGGRARYALLSSNSSSTWHGAMFYDQDFRPVASHYNQYTNGGNYYGANNNSIQVTDSTHAYGAAFFYNTTRTQSSLSSNSGYYLPSTTQRGMFGNSWARAYSDVTLGASSTSWNQKSIANFAAINSDHPNRRIVYLLNGQYFRARDVFEPGTTNVLPYPGTKDYTLTGNIANSQQRGTASYNHARKELIILAYRTSGGEVWCRRYRNIDFGANPSPTDAFNDPAVTYNEFQLSLASNWNNNTSESYYSTTPVLCDDGQVFVSVFFESDSHKLWKFTPSEDTTAVTATYLASLSTTTSYGADQGEAYYGKSMIMSYDMKSVAISSPYYYYGCGTRTFIINREHSKYTNYNQNNTGNGTQCLPYRNDGFCFYEAGNVYASNWNGAYITVMFYPDPSTGNWAQVSMNKTLGYYPGPNTTNYPGLTQVDDFYLTSGYNMHGPKGAF